MRILYLHQYFVPLKGQGGTRSYEFARRLITSGHKVRVITSSAMLSEPYRQVKENTRVSIDEISIIIIPVSYSNRMSFRQRMYSFIKFALLAAREVIREPADVIFATSTPLTIAIPAVIASRLLRVPMVFEVRDLWPELPIAIGALTNRIMIHLARMLEWIAYHASAHIIALSPGMAQGVIDRGIAPELVTVIPNSCDVALFDVPSALGQPIRERLGLVPGQPLIVYTGTFGIINGVDYLVEIATHMMGFAPQVRFLLIGDGKERDNVITRARETGVYEKSLFVWDPMPKEEMPAVLAAASVAMSVFIDLKPMWNNSANKFFDALAAAKPIAINYGGWQADILKSSGAGIALSGTDLDHDAQRLADWIQDTAALEKASQAARRLAHNEFNRDHMARKLEHVLQQVHQPHT